MFDERTVALLNEGGIDVNGTMDAWAKGHERLYMKHLRSFPKKPFVEEFVKALEMDDPQTAYGAIHSLKTDSGNLGMTQLYRLCAEAATRMKDTDPEHQREAHANGIPTAVLPNARSEVEDLIPRLREEMERMKKLVAMLEA